MAEPDWVNLFSQGLTVMDRAIRLVSPPPASDNRRGGDQGASDRSRGTRSRRLSPTEALQVASRVLDALEGKPERRRRGLFW
jgi:hypothetical protein